MSDEDPGGGNDASAEPKSDEGLTAGPEKLEGPVELSDDPPPPKRPSYVLLGVASALFFIADIGSKWWVVHHVDPKPRDMTDGWHLRLNRVENPGGAWGVFGDQPDYIRLPFFFIISAIALVFVVSLWKKLEPRQKALKWALPLLLGGALGNLLDRVRHQSVVDFLEFTIIKAGRETFRWPTFNVADIWICIGVGLMAIDMFTPRKRVPATVVTDGKDDRPAKASV